MKINDALLPLIVSMDTLHEDPGNVRLHPDRNLESIRASLVQFGQQKPIVVDHDGKIVAGNGTYRAALQLGATEIAAVPFSEGNRVRARAYGLADNRTAELAQWDERGLGEAFAALAEEGVDLNALGWADWEIDPLLRGALEPPEDRHDESSRAGVRPVSLTAKQRERFEAARDRLREYAGEEITEGGCVEQLSDYWIRSMAEGAPVE